MTQVGSAQISRLLLESLAGHGIEAELRGEWVARDDTGPALRGFARVESDDDGARVQLDVHVALPDGRLLVESHATGRPTAEAAIGAAFQKFTINSLPALLSAFFARPIDAQVTKGVWQIGDDPWDVHLGTFGVEMFPLSEGAPIDPAAPPVAPPPQLPSEVARLVSTRGSELRSPSWLRILFAQARGEPVVQEVLWNGQPWDEAREALGQLEWPKYDGYYSVRLFGVLEPQSPTPATWPLDYRSTVDVVRSLVRLTESQPAASDDDLCELLIDDGVAYDVAESVTRFTPIAFAYLLFQELDLSPDFHIADPSGDVVATRRLESEPAFVAARDLAGELGQASNPALVTVAERAGIFHAIHGALREGHPIPDLEIVVMDDDALASPPPSEDETAEPPDVDEAEAEVETPWWKFWRAD